MITVRKLAGLPEATRWRKILLLLRDWEAGFDRQPAPDPVYYRGILELLPPGLVASPAWDRRALNHLRHALLRHLGLAVADWDLMAPPDEVLPDRPRFPIYPYLEDLRSPFNAGSIFRTAEAFGCSGVWMSPATPDPSQPRLQKSAMGTTQVLPWRQIALADLSAQTRNGDLPLFALELGGTPLDQFSFPERGVCLLGSEELGLSSAALELADKSWGRVSIPLYGAKASLNVAVAWGILAAAWTQRLAVNSAGPFG